ncbi:MAG TPA: hypothetical protein PLF30_04610, partial [Candidatus Moranbacteria bacterium]|nr:hypothetical protein [Candidatus Moranbacteria bacterium]
LKLLKHKSRTASLKQLLKQLLKLTLTLTLTKSTLTKPTLGGYKYNQSVLSNLDRTDEALGDGKVSQETLDTGDPDGYFIIVYSLKKCDDGYWRMKATDKT